MFGFGKRRVEKLDFIVAGAQKSGTTALNYYLKRHPRIALPVKKELHFFDNDELFAGGTSLMSRSMKCFDRRAPVVSRARIARFIFIGGRLCRESGITTRR